MKVTPTKEQTERVKVVNKILRKMASCGRKFFRYKRNVARLEFFNGKLYYKNENAREESDLHIPLEDNYFKINHGSTLRGLLKEFENYILTGNGYYVTGLYSPHWGYPVNDMDNIREFAKSLNYPVNYRVGKEE